MKLYTSPGSCSSASHIALLEAGADFELVKLNLRTDRKLPDGRHLNDIHPKGYVPVLELDDGSLLTENVAILQYIADQYPDSPTSRRLLHVGATRAVHQLWITSVGTPSSLVGEASLR